MDTISKHQSDPITLARSEKARRRYYRREQKVRIVEETLAPGASVSVIARKHDVNANILFTWRRQYKSGELAAPLRKTEPPALLPILVGTEPAQNTATDDTQTSSRSHIEIHLADGRWILLSGSVDAGTLKIALAELMRP